MLTTSPSSHGRDTEAEQKCNPEGAADLVPEPKAKWTLRRTLSFVLVISGIIWLAIGLALRFALGKSF